MGLCNAQHGSGPTRGLDCWGHRGAQPASHPWRGPTPRPTYRGTPGPGEGLLVLNGDFSWLTKGEVEILDVQLAQELSRPGVETATRAR